MGQKFSIQPCSEGAESFSLSAAYPPALFGCLFWGDGKGRSGVSRIFEMTYEPYDGHLSFWNSSFRCGVVYEHPGQPEVLVAFEDSPSGLKLELYFSDRLQDVVAFQSGFKAGVLFSCGSVDEVEAEKLEGGK